MKKNVFICFSFSLVFCVLVFSELRAGGISSPNASMYLGNLKIGQTYSLQQLLGFPFSTTYRGRSSVGLSIGLVVPDKAREDGFKPEWIQIHKTQFTLDPYETAETDITIAIPNDEGLMGKTFLVHINPQTTAPRDSGPGLAFGTGLLCNLTLQIAAKPPTPEEIRQLKKQRLGAAVEVLITPERIFLNEIEPGKKVDVKKTFGDVLKIVNSSDFDIQANIESIPVQKSGIFPPEGYEESPDPLWLKPQKTKYKIKKNTVQEIPLFVQIPKDEAHLGKKYYFILSTDVTSPIRNVRYRTKVYVDTAQQSSRAEEQ